MPDDPSTQSDLRIETGSRARELPQEAQIRKRFDKFQDFVDMYRSRISLGGAFVDADVLRPVGSEVYLDFRLKDDYRLMHGLGEVVWVRLKTMSDERPKGMGLRFLSLDEGGRELVLKLLEEQVKSGGAPFEVDRVPEDGSIDPTVVQAMAGPSAEENEAAQKAKTGSREAQKPESAEDGDELPDLPPGVLPPPDEEPDFSAPWGEQLPEIPDELLEESTTSSEPSMPSIPAVEAPESPYAPGSDFHDQGGDAQPAAPPQPAAQTDFAFDPPSDGGDPHLDETDFGASAWATAPEDSHPEVKPLGGATTLQEAQGGDPFSDFDSDSVPEVDGTLFQLPDTSRAAAAASEPPSTSSPAAEPPAVGALPAEPTPAEPSFAVGEETPSFEASEPSFAGAASTGGGGFDAGGLDAGGLDGGGFDAGGFDADGGFDVDFGLGDDTGSQVAPPPDIGDSAGRAWDADLEAPAASETGPAEPAPAAAVASSAAPRIDATPQPTPEETAAMDAAMDIDASDFAFEPPEADLVDAPPGSGGFDRSDVATPEAIAAAALADQMTEDPVLSAAGGTSAPSNTDTADDLFAFRGPADAQPALDPEETASLRKGSLLPDLSETVMGTKAPTPAADGEDLHHSYDDWEEWAPHPTKSRGRSKMLIGLVLVVLLVGGASYFFRSTLMPMIGFGGGSDAAPQGPPPSTSAAGEDEDGAGDSEVYTPPDDPLAEPVEVAEPDLGGDDSEEPSDAMGDSGTEEPATEPQTAATAESLRPPPKRPEPPPQEVPAQQSPRETSPPPKPAPREPARATGGVARHVVGIDVRPGAGATEVVIRLDGDIRSDQYSHDKLSWAPDKEMVTLLGFENFEQTQIAGRGSHLRQVRVGFHPGKELRLVFDLVSDAVSIQGIQAQGNQLVVQISN